MTPEISNLIIAGLLILVCLQLIYTIRAYRKLKRYSAKFERMTTQLSRFHDIHWLNDEFGWLTKPFFEYVTKGERHIENVRHTIREGWARKRDQVVDAYITTSPFMKSHKDENTDQPIS